MRILKQLCLALVLLICLTATSQTIDKFSIDSGGASTALGGIEILYTIGEVNIQELNSATFLVSEGFINSEKCSGATTTWDGTSWNNGVPDNKKKAIIAGEYISNVHGNIDACEVTISLGFTLTITAGNYLNVENNIIVNGTLIVAHEGSLVQINDLATTTNNGSINVIKTTPVNTGNSFSILGSPMSDTSRGGTYANNNVVMSHQTAQFNLDPTVTIVNLGAEHFADTEGDNWQFISNGTTSIFPSEGYLVGPTTQGVIDGFYNLTYNEGTLNNGIYTKNIIYNIVGSTAENKSNSPNILSNPYASAIDADLLISSNSVIDELYFWEHLTAPSSSYPGYRFENWSMGDISIRNVSGGIMAPNGGATPTQYIASGQGFAIKANAAGTVTFNNSLRVTGNNTGYRNSETERMYINISNETYALKSSTLVAFSNAATDEYEAMFDTKRLATPISVYSILDEKELAIQGRSTFNTDQIIPIGFRTMVEEDQTYIIWLGEREGEQIESAKVYLQDNLLNTLTDLTETNYTFIANESNQKDRFVIVFENNTLGNDELSLSNISLYPNPTRDILTVVSPQAKINNVAVYDIRGRLISEARSINQSRYNLDMSTLNTAMYFVKVRTDAGIIAKIIVKE